ncbi:hypothetical protein C922_02445 [Plasmodium inui San Antonio 1]|uniref:Uncharacterized protein n=1 Tax=Plasmodium inui San Antonio 1 TaxID=1237626 RepID=W7A676_9APIC|nr:hypothetical protein C922_02445 [Plasmodium inui San Antonio 1]EUD67295.1 hypothetical protein C922_02445 [Plasmodium inui San Antonio 1]
MKRFYHRQNKTSGGSSHRANCARSQNARAGVPSTGCEAESTSTPQQPRGISYREAKKGKKGIPRSIASNSDNKTGSSRSCWSYALPDWNAPKKKQKHVDNHIVETKKAYTSISTAPHRSKYAHRPDPRPNIESSSPRICLVKRLNGKVEKIDMKDIQTAFPNYIPYEKNDNSALLSSVFSSAEETDQTQGKVGDISNLPVVYQDVELNLDLVKKCRQASKSRNPFSGIRQRSAKPFSTVKLPIGTTRTSQTARRSNQKAPRPSRSFSCNNTIYNPSAFHPKNGLKSTPQKRTFSNVQTWSNTPGGGSNFSSSGRSPIRRFQSAQTDTPPQQTILQKPYVIPMLLRHSTNMILSQLRKMKANQRTDTKGTSINIKNKEKQKEVQVGPSSFSKKQMDNQTIVNGKRDKVDYPCDNSSSVKDYHQVVVGTNCCSSSPVGGKKGDLTLQRLLAKKTKVKSIEKEKYIEKVNPYKVIHQSDDFASIYQNRGDRITNDHCIDVSSLLCIPGYVGAYLCESNSTVNHSYVNGKGKTQEKDTKRSGSITSARSFTTHPQQEQGQLPIYPDLHLLNDDIILYYLEKAINSSPTLNVDLKYLLFLSETLKNRKLRHHHHHRHSLTNAICVITSENVLGSQDSKKTSLSHEYSALQKDVVKKKPFSIQNDSTV